MDILYIHVHPRPSLLLSGWQGELVDGLCSATSKQHSCWYVHNQNPYSYLLIWPKAIKLGLIAIEDCDSDNVKSNVFPFNIKSIISSFNMAEIYRF